MPELHEAANKISLNDAELTGVWSSVLQLFVEFHGNYSRE
jgi:hypothetical protein